jgi:hypothetical protein
MPQHCPKIGLALMVFAPLSVYGAGLGEGFPFWKFPSSTKASLFRRVRFGKPPERPKKSGLFRGLFLERNIQVSFQQEPACGSPGAVNTPAYCAATKAKTTTFANPSSSFSSHIFAFALHAGL